MNRSLLRLIVLFLSATALIAGCTSAKKTETAGMTTASEGTAAGEQLVYEGEITGLSERAKTISLTVGKGDEAKVMLIKFDDQTKGINSAAKGRAAKVIYTKRDKDAYATEIQLKLAKIPEGVTEIKTEELHRLISAKTPLFLVDSRPSARYDQAHLPGAHSIPLPVLEKKQAELLPKDKDNLLIFYCGGITCPLSPASATIAKKLGYTNVRVYNEGEPAWSKAKLPTYSTAEFIKNGNVVLVDIRPSQQAIDGRIKGAYSVPLATLEERLRDVPRNAPLVLYGEQEATEAVAIVRDEEFSNVSLVEGGYAGWIKSGGETEKGPIYNTEIKWVRKLGKGEVSLADFRKAASGEDKDAIIVDARTKEEVVELGRFKNSVNIPLDEIPARMQELPKDKKIYVHCSTGARADMAYNELVKHGFNVKFLLLNIKDAECDCEIIRP